MSVLGVGIDLESVARFREKKYPRDRRFFDRIFSESEIAYCRKFRDSAPHFAARFCAKEALVKGASAVTDLYISDAEVIHDGGGAPVLRRRSGRAAARAFFARHDVMLSISHTEEWATACVVIQKKKGRRK